MANDTKKSILDDVKTGDVSLSFLEELGSTEQELREVIEFLIHHRQLVRDQVLEKLERDARELIERLERGKKVAVVEELSCFKEVLALHRQMIEDYDQPQH